MNQLSWGLAMGEAVKEDFIPPDRVLSLDTGNQEVRRIRSPKVLLAFCQQHHYLHQGQAAHKGMVFARAYGLFLGGELAGVAVFNVPGSSAVEKALYADYSHQKGMLALTRLCCHPAAPFNSESYLLSQSIKLLERDNEERLRAGKPAYRTVITYADFGLLQHTGTVYRSINAWFAGTTIDKSLAGFRHPQTGQIVSARQGRKTLSRRDCPDGFVPFGGTTKFKYLMFLGAPRVQLETMRHLRENVLLRSKFDSFYAWREGPLLSPRDPRAYDEVYHLAGRKTGLPDALPKEVCL